VVRFSGGARGFWSPVPPYSLPIPSRTNLVLWISEHRGRRFLVKDLRYVEPVVPTAVGRGCRAVRHDILPVEKVSHPKIPGEFDGKRDFIEAAAGRSHHGTDFRITSSLHSAASTRDCPNGSLWESLALSTAGRSATIHRRSRSVAGIPFLLFHLTLWPTPRQQAIIRPRLAY
jgi:hypothetical protein